MKQKNKRRPSDKTNSINSNKAESNMSNDGKKGSNTKSSCDFKKLLCIGRMLKKKFIESKDMSEERKEEKDFLHKALGNLLTFHPLILSGISLVGMIYYFAYFGFELKYFPDLGGADVAYVGVSLFFMLATISLFFILPCLCYPGYHKKDIGWIFFFGLSLLPLFTLVCMATLNTIINKSLDVLFWFSLIGSFIYLIIVICTDKFTTFSLCKVAILIIIIAVVVNFIVVIEYFPENFSFNGWFFSSIVGLYLMTLVYFKGLEYFYNNNDLIQFVVAFIIVVFAILSWFVTNEFANRLGIANVEYKYLSIEKSALGALPKEICDITNINLAEENLTISYADNKLTIKDENNNSALCGNVFPEYIKFSCEDNECKNIKEATNIKYQNKNLSYAIVDKNTLKENNFTIGTTVKVTLKENITYIEKQNDVILLRNIKAISTLGKFYYLETIGYKNKDDKEIKFELDASKIISREK
ncbi:hypothetical protein [Campylobacter concisus]|jgi:putative membrane protein|uniref:hypothetical protein n=1 Tax=Campylobacter concisus TaxID=199 RepID=UPI000CD7E58D|nr:hypothetical protein [Campylobacter concisus]